MPIRQMGGLLLAVLVVFAASCNGKSPTEPIAPPVVTIPVRLDFAISTTSSHTLRSARMTLDGREVATTAIPGGGGQARLRAELDVPRGSHTIQLVIVEQASSPNEYISSGSITTPTKILDMVILRDVLATGEALEYKVTLGE